MCRWITLLSSEKVPLSDIVLAPSNSLIQLSKDASFHPGYSEMNNHRMNGDGFGIGWYHCVCPPEHRQSDEPCSVDPSEHFTAAVFKDTQPAWNNANLRELCKAVESHCVVAHVRAASPFAGISEPNCHPFKAGRLLFCHNGRIPTFNKIRRSVMMQASDEAYVRVRGTTDSEAIFALILTYLAQDVEFGSPFKQTKPFGHKRMTAAVKRALRSLERTLDDAGVDTGFSTLNFCLTDGETVVVTRFCNKSPQVPPPSLYFAFGDARALERELIVEEADPVFDERDEEKKDDPNDSDSGTNGNDDDDGNPVDLFCKVSAPGKIYADIDKNSASFIVSSCPLTRTHAWNPMPKNSIMWYTRGSFPELRMLKRRRKTRSFIMMPPPTPEESEIINGLFPFVGAVMEHV